MSEIRMQPALQFGRSAMIEEITPAIDSRLRRLARKNRYALRRSRCRRGSVDNFGGYMLIDEDNCVVAGSCFDLGPTDVEALLTE